MSEPEKPPFELPRPGAEHRVLEKDVGEWDATVEFRELRWARETLNFTDAQLPPPRPIVPPFGAASTRSTLSSTTASTPSKPHPRHLHQTFAF